MKKIKLLTSLVGLTGLSMGLIPTIASCGCSTNNGLQVELVSKKKEREFNQKTNGCSYTFKTENVSNVNDIKVKIINLKVNDTEVSSVAGLFKTTYDSAGNIRIIIDTNILVAQWPTGTKFVFDVQFTNKSTGDTVTISDFIISYNPLILVPCFETADWSLVIEKATKYYSQEITLDEFVKSFGDEDGFAFTSIDEYLGLTKTIIINNKEHVVRVIDINHDTLATPTLASTTALFTFQLETLLSGTSGDALTSKWDLANNCDYTNSVLRWNLNGAGSGTRPASDVWDNSALSMLPTELSAGIQTVIKHVATSNDGGENYDITNYNDKLFVLTHNELALATHEWAKDEGTPYKYCQYNPDKFKRDFNGNSGTWWICTPSTAYSWNAWTFQGADYADQAHWVDNTYRISFAFCI